MDRLSEIMAFSLSIIELGFMIIFYLYRMKNLQFTIKINTAVNKVFDLMLGLSNKSTYEQWTALFNPTSTFEGNWTKGSKMLFVGIDEQGEKGGVVSEIIDNRLNHFISIRHFGLVKGSIEITEGSDVEKWANGFENYTFEERDGVTTLTVDLDLSEDFSDYMNENYPKALIKLKEICEDETLK